LCPENGLFGKNGNKKKEKENNTTKEKKKANVEDSGRSVRENTTTLFASIINLCMHENTHLLCFQTPPMCLFTQKCTK
jgi:hypothetical protein